MHGLPEARPLIAAPAAQTPAARAGLRGGDLIRAVDGRPIETWQELRWRVLQAALQGEALKLEALNARGELSIVTLDLRSFARDEVDAAGLDRIGLRLYRPVLAPVIGKLVPDGPAEHAGLAPGDRVTAVNGKMVQTWDELVEAIRAHPDRALRLSVQRGGKELEMEVTPEAVRAGNERIGRVGAAPYVPASYTERIVVQVRHGPLTSLAKAIEKTFDISLFSLRMLGKMLLGELSWKHLSGPVTIADFAGQSAQLGWVSYLTFLALISISLGVLNLLPIPLLDGGHLMYYAIEIIKGSPVSERAMELGQRVGLALLLVMMAFAFYNDLNRLFSG
jgi:regulator of sigma E protease